MGKPKKGKANYEDEELENADSVSGKADSKESQKPGENTKGGKDKKKKKGKGKNEDDYDSEEDAKIEQHVSDQPAAKKEKKKQKGKTRHDDNLSEDEAVLGKPDQKQTESVPVSKKDKKKKKGKGKEDADDSEADDDDDDHTRQTKPADKTKKETTHISKKDKKQKGGKAKAAYDEDDSDADSVPEKSGQGLADKAGDPPALSKKQKKKKGKAKDEDSEDDDEKELAAMLGEIKIKDEPAVPAFNKIKDKKVNKASVFELIGDMMDEDAGDDAAEASDQDTPEEKVVVPVPAANKSKKEKKNKKNQKNPEEEDIDAIMASLEDPSAGKKKGKKKKKNEEEEDSTTVSDLTEVQKVEPKVVTIDDLDDEEYDTKKKKKGKKAAAPVEEANKSEDRKEAEDGEEEGEEGGTVKSAAQKRKEKRDKEKQKKQQEKQKQKKPESKTTEVEVKLSEAGAEAQAVEDSSEAPKPGESATKDGEVEEEAADGKKKKKKKGEKAEKEDKAKPNKKLALLKEHLKKMQEEEQKAKEEEERQRVLEEERIRLYEEQKRLEEERKQKKKQKEKERIERLKREGKFLTEKQKQDKRRLEQMLEAMKKDVGEPTAVGTEPANKHEVAPRKKPIYTKKKKQTGIGDAPEKSPSPTATSPTEAEVPAPELKPSAGGDEGPAEMVVEVEVQDAELVAEEAEDVKDAWDAESEGEEEDEEEDEKEKSSATPVTSKTEEPTKEEESSQEEESSEEEEEEEEDEEEESESESDDDLTPAEKGRDKVMKRTEKANKERNVENLRAPVVCVLGHVDTGKTKILDKLRRTNVQDGEAGGITQQIGATNVPKDAILEKTKMCKEFTKQELKLPGLLIIDTPGHESFSNLRVRGTSLCDIAILVVDIMHGLEPQTIESINLLKERKTPFLVALNKIDRLYQWKAQPAADVQNTVKKQSQHTKSEFDERARNVILQLAEQGMNAALFYENKNPKEYVSMVPTSAHSGDGMGNLVALICDLCQTMLAKRLMFSPYLQAVVMEVKAITGMGTTIDVILINGTLKEGDTIVLAGTEGPIVTQIRGLLMPQPMKELRVKNQYEHFKVVQAAQGVKVIAKDMEKALAGLPLYVAHDNDEKEYYKEEVAAVLKETLESIKVQDRGVFVQASTLGSLEALLEFLKTSEIPYAGISIGPVHKKDIMKASVMLEHDSQYAVILAFDVKVERDAQEMAENLGVRIFTADIIYHLFDAFIKYRDDLKKKKQEEFRHIAVFPCKLRILPQFIFNSRDPIVMGVSVEAGFVKEGTPICVPSKEFVDIGRVASIEMNHKTVDIARQGQEICIKIVPIPGEAPKMYGRHFEETDILVSKISRQSIDAVKDHFREEMTKQDWKLMVELKKQFEIL